MREHVLLFLSFVIGGLMLSWGAFQIRRYLRATPAERRSMRFYFYIGILFFIIGLGDFTKAIRDLIALARGA